MHDMNGLPLAIGDKVVFRATITSLAQGEDYCNVGIRSIAGRRPDGQKESVNAINTGVLLRANEGDTDGF